MLLRLFEVTTMSRPEVNVTELVLSAQSNNYKRGLHKEKDIIYRRET
jgi:hypothetical protein